eukprot:TRINITY_DN5979_c0_g1_i1.p2 TRINITY_DN5979_c0_g1~~TRINITY_DN5979_c0_g1_i1.p2  ORF type:complete len:111 (-),score=16.97 TRINITY_DN5979_c0_g1_i1:67-399(-)
MCSVLLTASTLALRLHKNDESLSSRSFSVAGWAVEAGEQCYRHFRVLQHGLNSGGQLTLMCCGIELYGPLLPILRTLQHPGAQSIAGGGMAQTVVARHQRAAVPEVHRHP